MSNARRSTHAGPHARAAAASSGAQRRTPADHLDLAVRDAEVLARDFRRGARDARHFHELEERAHAVARDILAPFRGAGARPVNPPLHVSADGRSAAW